MSIERNWSMRLPIIWNDRDVYCFMLFCFRLIFEDLKWRSYQHFFNDHNWIQMAQNGSQQLTTVLNYSPNSYRLSIDQLKFSRNCTVHVCTIYIIITRFYIFGILMLILKIMNMFTNR